MLVFPLDLLPAARFRWRIAGATLSGGQPISGAPQSGEASAGGWWVLDLEMGNLYEPDQIRTWRALLVTLMTGKTPIAMQVFDTLQPFQDGFNPWADVPFSDGAAFSDGALFVGDPLDVQLAAAAYMPAWPAPPEPPTQADFQLNVCGPFRGGEYFSLVGASGNPRAHLIGSVELVGAATRVTFKPPLREDYAAGTQVAVTRPFCLVKYDITQPAENAWLMMEPPFKGKPSIRFVEAFPPPS